jgi:hypothetical protein
MTIPSTTRDIQRATFIESLHNSLKKQASQAIEEQKKFITLASSYIEDGLEEVECIELLMIDGLSREAAESYASMALSEEVATSDDLNEYSFQFEDAFGKIWSSYDIGETVKASDEKSAVEKADELLLTSSTVEHSKVLSVSRIS